MKLALKKDSEVQFVNFTDIFVQNSNYLYEWIYDPPVIFSVLNWFGFLKLIMVDHCKIYKVCWFHWCFFRRTDLYLKKTSNLELIFCSGYPEKFPVAVMKLGLRTCILIFNLSPNKAKVFLPSIFWLLVLNLNEDCWCIEVVWIQYC